MSRYIVVIYQLFILLTLSISVYVSAHDQKNYSQFLSRVSINEGLSQSSVTKIVQGPNGFIWLGTKLGLNRYDGYRAKQIKGPFRVFDKEHITTLHVDYAGYIWVATLHSGLFRVDPNSLEAEHYIPNVQNNGRLGHVTSINQHNRQHLWLGMADGTYHLDIATKELHRVLQTQENNEVKQILWDQGALYSATRNGLYRTDLAKGNSQPLAFFNSLLSSSEAINIIQKNRILGLLVGTTLGLYAIAEDETVSVLIENHNIRDISLQDSHYMVATSQGLFKFTPKSKQLDFLLNFSQSQYQTSDNTIADLFYDRIGNYWLASNTQGAMIWASNSARFSQPKLHALRNQNVWAIFNDEEGVSWIGSDQGLFSFSKDNKRKTKYKIDNMATAEPKAPVITAIYANSDNPLALWLLKSNGIYQFDKSTATITPAPYFDDVENQQWLSGLYVIDNSNMFYFTQDGHFHYDALAGKVEPLIALDELANPALSVAFLRPLPNRPNTILLSASGRLIEYNFLSKQSRIIYQTANYIPQSFDYVDSWVLDTQNTLWLAVTGEGLIGLDYDTLKERHKLTLENGLQGNALYSLQLTANNKLWVSSQKGLYRVDISTMQVQHFDSTDGLLSDEFNAGAYSKRADGLLQFGSPMGIAQFAPARFDIRSARQSRFPIALSDIEIISSGRNLYHELANKNTIELEHNELGLHIQFSTLQFHKQKRARYDISLSGPSKFNIEALQSNELFLPQLLPGEHKLEIREKGQISTTPSLPLVIHLKVLHAPWRSPMAKMAYIVMAITTLFLLSLWSAKRKAVIVNAHNKAKASQEQMELALKGSNSGVWDYDVIHDKLYQGRFSSELGYEKEEYANDFKTHLSLIASQQQATLELQWGALLESEMSQWDVTYQLRHQDGRYIWFRDTGMVIERDQMNKPQRVAGTYTNINQTKANEEQAILFGKALSKINDAIIVLDTGKQPVTANEAFYECFDLQAVPLENLWVQLLTCFDNKKEAMFNEVIDNIAVGETWQGQEVLFISHTHSIPLEVKINAVSDQSDVISHYVIVLSDITEHKKAQDELLRLAHYDNLTDLPNRQLLEEKIAALISQQEDCALLFIDLDKFKQVNDLYGHLVGDLLLRSVSEHLLNTVDYYDMVARHNGDEFMVLITTKPTQQKLAYLADKIIEKLTSPFIIEGNHVHISACVGIASYPKDCEDAPNMIKMADLAMVHAKRIGHGETKFYDQAMAAQIQSRLRLEEELRLACHQNEFSNFYQPIIDNENGKIIGYELLLRWFTNNGMVSPGKFISVAEEIGLISQMTINAIDQALLDYVLLSEHSGNVYISVNLSPIHILQEGLTDTLNSLLSKHKLPVSTLRLEITEGTLLADLDVALVRLNELRQCGFKLLLDDFGTGYSSLTYLSRFPINVIKIDKSFVLDSEKNEQNQQIIKSIIALAENLKLDLIAEGVENIAHLDFLSQQGCHLIQGYYFARPMPINAAVNFSQKNGVKS